MNIVTAAIVVLIAGVHLSHADTPANCTYDDIAGIWTFHEGTRGGNGQLNCTDVQLSTLQHSTDIELLFPNIAIDKFGNKGKWTMIYNQGFEVYINSRRYFAFSNFTQIEHHAVVSRCGETMSGWSHDVYVRDWSCWIGRRKKTLQAHRQDITLHNTPIRHSPSIRSHLHNTLFTPDTDMIASINTQQNSWVAVPYFDWQDYTLQGVLRRMGGYKSRVHSRPRERQNRVFVSSKADMKTLRSLPAEFDWRNVSGVNYVSPVRNQGACGSCYAFASAAMLEARYRIATNNTQQPVYSPQDVVQCSVYSQGCDGGFPYLIAGKYAEDYGFVHEDCNPYSAHPTGKCATKTSCRRYYATNYGYIGGYYGATNEPLMRMELVRNGPFAVGFEVYDDFMSYRSGVYHHTFNVDRVNQLSKLLNPHVDLSETITKWDPFQLTNHAVLVVGYGTDEKTGEDYWTVKNSWGTTWGEEGFFRIRRGVDECGIESLAVHSIPIPTY